MAKPSTAARAYLTLIGLLLAAAGGVFTWLMWRSYERADEIREWPGVACAIIRSEVEQRRIDPNQPPEYRLGILYSYEWDGETYESDRYRLRGASWTKDRESVEELSETLAVGTVTEGRVNPEAPGEAVLRSESRAPGYSIWFPLIFVVGGLGVVVGAWRRGS